MTTSDASGRYRTADFSFGTRELAAAQEALEEPTRRAPTQIQLLDDSPLALLEDDPGFDPYNSSGRFDRHDAWKRVKRR